MNNFGSVYCFLGTFCETMSSSKMFPFQLKLGLNKCHFCLPLLRAVIHLTLSMRIVHEQFSSVKPQSHCPGSAAGLATDLRRAPATDHIRDSPLRMNLRPFEIRSSTASRRLQGGNSKELRSMALKRPYSSTKPSRSYRELLRNPRRPIRLYYGSRIVTK